MVRENLSEGAPYFAVCRPADEERTRVQYRQRSGESTEREEANVVEKSGVDHGAVSFLRIETFKEGEKYCVRGYASRNGLFPEGVDREKQKEFIHKECFLFPLRYQGVASSSHDGRRIKFLYGNLRKGGHHVRKEDFEEIRRVGGAWGRVFDGFFPPE